MRDYGLLLASSHLVDGRTVVLTSHWSSVCGFWIDDPEMRAVHERSRVFDPIVFRRSPVRCWRAPRIGRNHELVLPFFLWMCIGRCECGKAQRGPLIACRSHKMPLTSLNPAKELRRSAGSDGDPHFPHISS